jgi:hypothetical protein
MARQLITGAAQSVGKAAKTLVAAVIGSESKPPPAQTRVSGKTASSAKKAPPKPKTAKNK